VRLGARRVGRLLVQPTYTMRKRRLSSRTLPQGNGDAGPTLAGGAIGGERNLIVLDAGDVLYDAFAVRRSPAPVLFRLSLHGRSIRVLYFEPIGPDRSAESFRFETMPLRPRLQACRNTVSPSPSAR
jgi:hypothetical protein